MGTLHSIGPEAVAARRALYDAWAPYYMPVAHNALMRTDAAVMTRIVRSVAARSALDLGSGTGRYAASLRHAGATRVVSLDFSHGMLARGARTDARVCADARRLPFSSDRFDLVTAALMAGDIDDLTDWLREVARVLTGSGTVVYSDFHPSWARFGWRRTFTAAGGVETELPFRSHSLDEHLVAVRRAGLVLQACHEVPLADDGSEEVRRFRRRWGNPPVLVVVRAVQGGA